MDFPSTSDTGVRLPIRAGAIAFDMDGTLLDYDGHLSDSVVRSVRLIAGAGIKVFLVSGRTEPSCLHYWRALQLDTPLASCNGARVGFPGEKPIVDHRLSAPARDTVLAIDKQHACYINYCIENSVYTLHDGPERDYYSSHFIPVDLSPGPEDILSRPLPSKCVCITAESDMERFLGIFTGALGDLAAVTSSNARFIEIIPTQANKGEGLGELAKWSGIPLDRFIAVGDAMNDKPMLERAAFAITFKSGDPRLVDCADMVLPPLWEDGMDILAKCILGLTASGRFLTARSNRFF